MTVAIEPMAPDTLDQHLLAIEQTYRSAFEASEDEGDAFIQKAFARHRTYPGFQGCIAFEGERLTGFVYGYPSRPDGWWHSTIRPALVEHGHASWLEDAFEFVELAVAPAHQGKGIGGRLHDTLLARVSERTALLSTGPAPSNAHHLYASRGWQILIPEFRFSQHGDPAVIMGLDMPTYRSRHT